MTERTAAPRRGFSSHFGLIMAALGMAIGTGNIWRFPRVTAENGGGTFLIPWLIFLLTWSIPILVAEFTLGKVSRRGPIGAFAKLLGPQAAWMGAFIGLTTLLIASYYSVVTGWTLKYLVTAVTDGFSFLGAPASPEAIRANHDEARAHFLAFTGTWESVGYHLAAAAVGLTVVGVGVRRGIESFCSLLIPLLFIVMAGGAVWAISTLDGAGRGLEFFFRPDWDRLFDRDSADVWIAAITQSAWSTGAGWGLILTYGAYARRDDDAVLTNATTGFGNNCASYLVGLFIFPAAFALLGQAGFSVAETEGALKDSGGKGGTGLAFQYIPFIFKSLPEGARVVTITFFAALFAAALSSLIAMYEMGTRMLMDMGLRRKTAVLLIGIFCAGLGIPSALDIDFLVSMDWAWSLGLIAGGLMIVWAVQLYGIRPFARKLVNGPGARVKVGWGFSWLFLVLLPLQAAAMLGWWLFKAATDPGYYEDKGPWDPLALGSYNAGTPVIWCGTAIVLLMILSPLIGRASLKGGDAS